MFRPDLAGSLINLSLRLASLGRPENALTAIEEAVTIRREMARAHPDAGELTGLASSLNNLSIRLAGLGRPEDALTAIEEALTIRRQLAARWPDAHHHEAEGPLHGAPWLDHGEDLSGASPQDDGPLSGLPVLLYLKNSVHEPLGSDGSHPCRARQPAPCCQARC